MKEVTHDILNTLLSLVLFYIFRGLDMELRCDGEEPEYGLISGIYHSSWSAIAQNYQSQGNSGLSKNAAEEVATRWDQGSMFYLHLKCKQAARLTPGTGSGMDALAGVVGQYQHRQRALGGYHWDPGSKCLPSVTELVPLLRKHSSLCVFLH